MQPITRLAAVGAGTAALFAITTPMASAGDSVRVASGYAESASCGETYGHADAMFKDNGDWLVLEDAYPDGHSVGASLYVNGRRVDTITNRTGYGSRVSKSHSWIDEGSAVSVSVWVNVDGKVCGYYHEDGGVA